MINDSKNDVLQKKKDLDKFYTGKNIVNLVIENSIKFLSKAGIDITNYKFLEPCAGNGSFLDGLKDFGITDVESFDIEPEREDIIKADFLELDLPKTNNYITIGNPPFGYKGKLAASFINRSSEWGDVVIFVLPIQFRRFNIQKQVYSNLKLVYSSSNLEKNSFLFDSKKYHVNSLYQIWVNRLNPFFTNLTDLRLLKSLPNRHKDFKTFLHNNTKETLKYFNKNEYQWDFAVVRQGYYDYNEKIIDPRLLIPNRQYLFVKYVEDISKKVFEEIDFVYLSKSNTSIPGFSNTDLVSLYIKTKEELLGV